jgi:hypothetical protein
MHLRENRQSEDPCPFSIPKLPDEFQKRHMVTAPKKQLSQTLGVYLLAIQQIGPHFRLGANRRSPGAGDRHHRFHPLRNQTMAIQGVFE